MSKPATARRVSVAQGRRRSKRNSAQPQPDEEAAAGERRFNGAIFNEEIERLRIREEDLQRVSQQAREQQSAGSCAGQQQEQQQQQQEQQQQQVEQQQQRVAVRRWVPANQRPPTMQTIGLLRRAPSDAPLQSLDAGARAGPRFDSRGHLVPHSILGRPEQFYRIGVRRGEILPQDVPPEYRRQLEADSSRSGSGSSSNVGSSTSSLRRTQSCGTATSFCRAQEPAAKPVGCWSAGAAAGRAPVREIAHCCSSASPMRHGQQQKQLAAASPTQMTPKVLWPQFSFIGERPYRRQLLLG